MSHNPKYISTATLLQLKIHYSFFARIGNEFCILNQAERGTLYRLDTLFGRSVSDRPVTVVSTVFIQILL